MRNVNQEIRGYGNMSTYGYIKHDEMTGYAIAHHGIKGQKWGIRRYQNEDGSLTEEGKKRYLDPSGNWTRKAKRELSGIDREKYELGVRREKEKKLMSMQ